MRLLSLKGTNIELTDAIKNYVNEKLDALQKICQDFDPADELRMELGKSTRHHAKGPYFFAEMHLHVPGKELLAKEESEDLYDAIDRVKDQLKRQLKDYKDVLKERTQKMARPGK